MLPDFMIPQILTWFNSKTTEITNHIGYVLDRSRVEKFENGVDH